MCSNRNFFTDLDSSEEIIILANKKSITLKWKGAVVMEVNGSEVRLKNVIYSPDLNGNFISVNRLVENGCLAKFDPKGFSYIDVECEVNPP